MELQARAEQEALQAASEFRTIFDATNDAIFISAFDGHFLEVNQAACQHLGYSREDLFENEHPRYRLSRVCRAVAGSAGDPLELWGGWFRVGAGTRLPVELNNRVLTYRRHVTVLGVARGISERKRSEVEFRRLLAEIEQIDKYAPVGLCVRDRELRYLRINERMAAMHT